MDIKVHDIVQFETIQQLENPLSLPDWVNTAPASKNYGVVRRMPIMNKLLPIGLRGDSREKRHGAFIQEKNLIKVIPPTSLVESIGLFNDRIYYSALYKMKNELEKHNLLWGPTGSVGFEMATSIHVTTPNSDIDICIYVEQIEEELLVTVGKFLDSLEQRIDVQVEVPSIGAFLLSDYLKFGNTGFIVRTKFGPHLCVVDNNKIKLVVNN
ncbi:MAG TPA: malonate decarboxylase holo-ACP synthase [Ureibacillus sp.]|nr:malonate decarboxylase holo-ACP synthase [Ureibacillus sp.]